MKFPFNFFGHDTRHDTAICLKHIILAAGEKMNFQFSLLGHGSI